MNSVNSCLQVANRTPITGRSMRLNPTIAAYKLLRAIVYRIFVCEEKTIGNCILAQIRYLVNTLPLEYPVECHITVIGTERSTRLLPLLKAACKLVFPIQP
jgi:hypothetical protein